MPGIRKSPSRRFVSNKSATLGAFIACLLMPACCAAFPVDFILTEARQKEPPPAAAEETKAADEADAAGAAKNADAPEKAAPADKAAVADEVADKKAKPVPVKPRKGIVKQKAAAVAEGAAEAAEEVGQVIGNILGGLFGGRGVREQAPNVKLNAQALKQFEAMYGRHFDQIVRTELHFIRIVCQPTRQQYESMAADGKLIRMKVLNKFAMVQQNRQRAQNGSDDSDARKPVASELLISAKRHLSPDQVATYERELAARKEAHKDTSVLMTAAKLDRKLVLTADQRDKTVTMLNDNWRASWGSMSMLRYGDRYFPDVPDQKLIPILTKTQKNVWRTVNQQGRVFFGFNVGMAPGGAIADEEWEDEPEEKPAEEDLDPDKNVEASKDSKNDTKVKEPEDGQATASDSAVPAAEGSE
jgi:hypothetical protein